MLNFSYNHCVTYNSCTSLCTTENSIVSLLDYPWYTLLFCCMFVHICTESSLHSNSWGPTSDYEGVRLSSFHCTSLGVRVYIICLLCISCYVHFVKLQE